MQGIGRCYHRVEVIGNPGHAAMWSAATEGEGADWVAAVCLPGAYPAIFRIP